MEGQNEKKGLGKFLAGIKAFFSRKNKRDDDSSSKQDEVILEQESVVVEAEQPKESEVKVDEEIVVEDNAESDVSNVESDIEVEVVDSDLDDTANPSVDDLTPQQEYVASKNIRVTVTATTIRSFIAKVTMISDDAKRCYSELKNYILNFEGTRTRISWQYESFYRTKTLLARMAVRGKSLWIYLPIDIQNIPQGINCVEINDKKYKGLKSGLYIQGERTFKQAKRLISMVMEELGLNYIEKEYVDYIPLEMSEEEMLEKNLIRKIQTSTNISD